MTSGLSQSQAQLILDAIRSELFNLHTGLPGRIVSAPSNGAVDVQPLIKRVWLDDSDEEAVLDLPPIPRVPLLFPRGAGWSITWPLAVGDLVYLAFAERSLDRWKDAPAGTSVDPAETRQHSLADAVAHPALRPLSTALPRYSATALRLGREDGSVELELAQDGTITLQGSAIRLGTAALEPMVKGEALFALLTIMANAIGGIAPGSPAPNIAGVVTALQTAIVNAKPLVLSTKGSVQ